VDLRPDEVVLRIVRADEGIVGSGSCYRFLCPGCEELVEKPADERIAQLLTTGGVAVIEDGASSDVAGFELEAAHDDRPTHPERSEGGPPLTLDDLLDLHLRLAEDGWFDELLDATSA
jgi:hypothetical protein